MSGLVASGAGVATALYNAMVAAIAPGDTTPYFQQVYYGSPASFDAQSPVALLDVVSVMDGRLTMGAGRNEAKWLFAVKVLVDRTQLDAQTAFFVKIKAIDAIRVAVNSQVRLNQIGGTILSANLENLAAAADYRSSEGMLYACFNGRVLIYEQYNTTITTT